MDKYIVDGKVAVLISPGWGAGWSTWLHNEEAIFDTTLIQLLLDKQWDAVHQYAEEVYPDSVTSAISNLTVFWVPVGAQFRICEYHGNEYIEIKDEIEWLTA